MWVFLNGTLWTDIKWSVSWNVFNQYIQFKTIGLHAFSLIFVVVFQVGLAVDDIKEVQAQASLKRQAMLVRFSISLGYFTKISFENKIPNI